MAEPIVVTGTGLVTAAGDAREAVFASLAAQKPLAATLPGDDLATASMDAFDAKRHLFKRGVKDLSRTSQLACSAAAAIARDLSGVAADDVGVVFGSAWGALSTVIEFEREAYLQGVRFVDPILFTETVSNVPAGQVAIHHGWSAFNVTVSSGSASGLAGIGQALALLAEGRGLVAVAGGGDELNLPLLRALRSRGLVTGDARSLPLAASRSGPIGGEGACFLTLELGAHARSRGAAALATVRAFRSRFVPGLSPANEVARDSMAGLIRELMERAGLAPPSIDLVVLSANGLIGGDAEEGLAVLTVFGGEPRAPLVLAPKAILGETWGASGALAAAMAIEAMHTSTVPGAASGLDIAPELAALNVPRDTVRRPVRNALILDRTDAGHQLGLALSRDGVA